MYGKVKLYSIKNLESRKGFLHYLSSLPIRGPKFLVHGATTGYLYDTRWQWFLVVNSTKSEHVDLVLSLQESSKTPFFSIEFVNRTNLGTHTHSYTHTDTGHSLGIPGLPFPTMLVGFHTSIYPSFALSYPSLHYDYV